MSVTVAYPILCEAYTPVLYRLGGVYARQWWAEVLAHATPVNAEHADLVLGATHLERFDDDPITLVDAVLAAMSARLHMPVWTATSPSCAPLCGVSDSPRILTPDF